MRNLLFTMRYDGTDFHGWQVQNNAPTVQKAFQDAVEKITGKRDNIIGCSRTDAGVHANMYCCNMRTQSKIECPKFITALNAVMPKSIAVYDCREVAFDFHARYDCISKQYVYKIWNAKERNPFLEKYYYHYKYPLDVDMLNEEAKAFLGKHDYSAFCSSGASTVDNVRTVEDVHLQRHGDEVLIYFQADGFLYNMVRIMTGTLIDISRGAIEKGTISQIIDGKDRKRAGVTAPAHGLYLNKVNYEIMEDEHEE